MGDSPRFSLWPPPPSPDRTGRQVAWDRPIPPRDEKTFRDRGRQGWDDGGFENKFRLHYPARDGERTIAGENFGPRFGT